jgi:hypothetical protein
MISCGDDGTIRVLNLEQLSQLFMVKLPYGILDLRIIKREGFSGFMFTQNDGAIKLWETVR